MVWINLILISLHFCALLMCRERHFRPDGDKRPLRTEGKDTTSETLSSVHVLDTLERHSDEHDGIGNLGSSQGCKINRGSGNVRRG